MNRITAQQMMPRIRDSVIFDTRSPSEFEAGHIPGAISLPIFNDEERAEVGTLYKQTGPDEARLRGLELAGPKMRRLVEMAESAAPEKKAILHCWRGGQRSAAMGWLLDFADFEIDIVEGGYKAYREHVRTGINSKDLKFIVLGGQTGSGKTELLHLLKERGEQVVDLEGLANHKGSAFGWIGEDPQPTSEQFENNFFHELDNLDSSRRIWLENESRGIGRVFMPVDFSEAMRTFPLINISIDRQVRIKRLVGMYAKNKSELKASFEKITRKLGGQNAQAAFDALESGNFESATEIALGYYDKTYQFSLDRANPRRLVNLEFGSQSQSEIVDGLIKAREEVDSLVSHSST